MSGDAQWLGIAQCANPMCGDNPDHAQYACRRKGPTDVCYHCLSTNSPTCIGPAHAPILCDSCYSKHYYGCVVCGDYDVGYSEERGGRVCAAHYTGEKKCRECRAPCELTPAWREGGGYWCEEHMPTRCFCGLLAACGMGGFNEPPLHSCGKFYDPAFYAEQGITQGPTTFDHPRYIKYMKENIDELAFYEEICGRDGGLLARRAFRDDVREAVQSAQKQIRNAPAEDNVVEVTVPSSACRGVAAWFSDAGFRVGYASNLGDGDSTIPIGFERRS